MLKFSNYMLSTIEQIKQHNKLYEGLICSYSIKNTIQYFIKNIESEKEQTNKIKIFNSYKIKVSYSFINNENKALPYIKINFNKLNIKTDKNNDFKYIFEDENILFNKIDQWMNLCGWFYADIRDNFNNRINKTKELSNISYVIYRAKFDVEVTKDKWPKYLYHVTPSKNIDKIKKNGLIPKAGNKKIKHQDSIYLFDIKNDNELKTISNELNIDNKYNEFSSIKINMEKIPILFKLFVDPDLEGSYFTLDNIPSYCIEEIKIV